MWVAPGTDWDWSLKAGGQSVKSVDATLELMRFEGGDLEVEETAALTTPQSEQHWGQQLS